MKATSYTGMVHIYTGEKKKTIPHERPNIMSQNIIKYEIIIRLVDITILSDTNILIKI